MMTTFDRLRQACRTADPTVEVLRDDVVSVLNQADSWNDSRVEAQLDVARLLNRLAAAEEVVKQVRQQNPLTFRSTGLVYALNAHSKLVSEWRPELYGEVDGG